MDLTLINLETNSLCSKTNNNRSDLLKRMRSGSIEEDEEDLLAPKQPKNQYPQRSDPLLSLSTGPQTKMLSFSNPRSDSHSLSKSGGFGHTSVFPHHAYALNTGYGSGLHAPVMESLIGGAFTASQWAELQHQALVYKYIQANVTVPSGLLLGLRRSVSPYIFSGLHSGSHSYTPNSCENTHIQRVFNSQYILVW